MKQALFIFFQPLVLFRLVINCVEKFVRVHTFSLFDMQAYRAPFLYFPSLYYTFLPLSRKKSAVDSSSLFLKIRMDDRY